jgi:hypothetical protein
MVTRKKRTTRTKADAEETALAKWDEELAAYAEEVAKQEANTGGGNFFAIKGGGTLSFNDATFPNNEMAVIILDFVFENVYYEGDYNPDDITGPLCFAFGRDEESMAPHDKSEKAQCGLCESCPQNEWASSPKGGKGKACRNKRRLALIPAGRFDRNGDYEPYDPDDLATAEVGYLAVPPTSTVQFGNYAKAVAMLKRPPFAVVTKIKVVPDERTQFKIQFETIAAINGPELKTLLDRHKEQRKLIEFPYQPMGDRGGSKKKKSTRKKTAAKNTTVKKKTGRKSSRKTF